MFISLRKKFLARAAILFVAIAVATHADAQNNTSSSRPGSTARSSTSSSSRPTSSSSSTYSSNSSSGPRQYRSNTELGDATIQVDPETRSLVIVTDEDTHRELVKVIKTLDMPKPQVLIKVVFVEVTYDKGLDVGLEGNYTFNLKSPLAATTGSATTTSSTTSNNGGTTNINATGNPGTSFTGANGSTGTTTITSTLTSPLDTAAKIGQSLAGGSNFGLASLTTGSFVKLLSDNWSATLHALASRGKVEVLSRPSIMARNNQEAVIIVGQEVPFVTNSRVDTLGNTINTIQYDNIGIILRVTPFISAEDTVEMIVAPEISALTDQTVPISSNATAPVIDKRSAETVVVTPNAQTVVIGGLMESQRTSNVQKIPLLGDIPWLGAAFRHTVTSETKKELLIFLTPYIVHDAQGLWKSTAAEVNRAELLPKAFNEKDFVKYLDAPPLPEDSAASRVEAPPQWPAPDGSSPVASPIPVKKSSKKTQAQ